MQKFKETDSSPASVPSFARWVQQKENKTAKARNPISDRLAPFPAQREAVPRHQPARIDGQPTGRSSSARLARPTSAAGSTSLVKDGNELDHDQFALELENAKRDGPAKLSDSALVDFCRGAFGHFERHYWIKARPFFTELSARIEAGTIPEIPTKKKACELIGCSPSWFLKIVKGTPTKRSGGKRANKGRIKSAESTHPLTDAQLVVKIEQFALKKLERFRERDPDRFQRICTLVKQYFLQTLGLRDIDDLSPEEVSALCRPKNESPGQRNEEAETASLPRKQTDFSAVTGEGSEDWNEEKI